MYSTTRSLLVGDVMSHRVITSSEDEPVRNVASKMQRHKIGSIVVVNKSKTPVGIITQGDIVRKLASKSGVKLLNFKAKDLMSRPLTFIDVDKKLEDAAKIMVDKKVKKLCVRGRGKKLVGIITDHDIMRNAGFLINVLNEMISTGYMKEV